MSERWWEQSGWQLHLLDNKMPERQEDVISFFSAVACYHVEDLSETREEVVARGREEYEESRKIWIDALKSLETDYVTPNATYHYTPEQTEFYREEYTHKLRVAEAALAFCQ